MYTTVEDAFYDKLDTLMKHHADYIVEVRGLKTLEMVSQLITVEQPVSRCYFLNKRNDNIFAKIAETLWMLNGDDDIVWLSHYLPRAADFSDNGKTWRGAYGPRLRNYNGHSKKVDQLQYVVNTLCDDIYSRQAVISIWDPSEDTIPVTKDRPCNNWIQFYIRLDENKEPTLHMNITQRSCDLLWGYSGIDTFSWSVLQQMMATWVGAKVGMSNHFIGSLHIYERHWKTADIILVANHPHTTRNMYNGNIKIPEFTIDFEEFDRHLNMFFELEKRIRAKVSYSILDEINMIYDPFMRACAQMIFAYNAFLQEKSVEAVALAIEAMDNRLDFRLAAIEYFTRKDAKLLDYITTNTFEEHFVTKRL